MKMIVLYSLSDTDVVRKELELPTLADAQHMLGKALECAREALKLI